MSDHDSTHQALADLARVARAFRSEQDTNWGFSLETQPDVGRAVLDLDIDGYVEEFGRVTEAYRTGEASEGLPADIGLARSLIPPGTGALRDFSYVGSEIPVFDASNCVACMECVTQCPDTAILGKVAPQEVVDSDLETAESAGDLRGHWAVTRKFHGTREKQGKTPGLFGIFIDPTKCKGCAECVDVCGDHDALAMAPKSKPTMSEARAAMDQFQRLPDTSDEFIREKVAVDRMLSCEKSLLYVGGAGSCAGCGEASALRMLMAQLGWTVGRENIGLVAATGCNTVYSSTYPYNPFMVPWTNSLFENATAMAMGVRKRWDQRGWNEKALWVIGGDGALFDIGFGSLSRMLASGMNIKVLVLDTQVYSNTGGQASTASFTGQAAKMSPHGKVHKGKVEARKEIAMIAMMHPDTYVAQTTAAHTNHFYKVIEEAQRFEGPALVVTYTTCQPEHGVGDECAAQQAKLAVDSRAFPLLSFDPSRGERIRERLDLKGNPSVKADWHSDKEGNQIDFLTFARSEGRFAKHFTAGGEPTEEILLARSRSLATWRTLQELAGMEPAS
ncbi:MAG: thiamine pyrophosphate-dependent enzyme [Planctomycetota bacterium]|jgi:pyruvate/2-oxoacid:ferredoxin oxidoreductase beta subunit/Pyruvate/2-oxoacid:ferredoxin oxidoreductase delta subunit|nr:thiamine pyrophosphate-dependent enzyme [Planctomycetota bacterium]